ncbi:zf-HC2 domain-containing protein [Wenzhouxiangella sp. XN24]|uniref:zf-HC2 domain-containing protein n=1 Tax=Wenzhouxiangella sp. XN24 TaxID=2713569 RepID=UPI0013EBFD82|nr:zf-HC2 domain-containing protein [Wenzhouxiangella sp. XN24]NGX16968.1 hypothetical protein [Wenzhouxiangella sp. XN24]
MNYPADCKATLQRLDDLLDDSLSPAAAAPLHAHLAGCRDCAAALAGARRLNQALRDMPVPDPRPGFAGAALASAVARNRLTVATSDSPVPGPAESASSKTTGFRGRSRQVPRRRLDLWLGGVLGAAAAAALMVMLWGVPRDAHMPQDAADLRLTLYEPREIGVAIDADAALPGALLTITLQGGIDLVGFGAQRELQWQADLDAGTNVLPLPIIAHSLEQGRLTALVEHGEMTQQVELRIQVDAP